MIQVLGVCAGVLGETGLPDKLAYMLQLIVLAIQIVVPFLLIVWGMLDLGKAVIAQKEDEIKKGQQLFMKRVIAAVIVFFVVTITTLLVNLVADESETITGCIDDILACDKLVAGQCSK